MRILVTGGLGFLGAAFVERARAAGHSVAVLDQHPDADFPCTIDDRAAVASAMAATRPDVVAHLAAILTDAAADDPIEATRINALGTAIVFTAAVGTGVSRIVYASSVAAVGSCREGSGDAVGLAPQSVYGATKAFGEHLARAMAGTAGVTSFVILRFGWIYGRGRARGWRAGQEVIERFARGEQVVRYPDFPQPIDWTYIADAGEVLLRAAERPLPPFSAFNVLGDRRTMREAVGYLSRRFPGIRAEPVPAETPPSAWGLRNDGLEAALGYRPSTLLETGIDAMLSDGTGGVAQ
ncbi:MAG TPA: NAD(P)-dependent oxidoreductase [Stellaceae bacterium]|nr:NAD(P)-dependent oxidoreductase [Stellaceae bacterium]